MIPETITEPKVALEALKAASDHFNRVGIEHWIDFGSLLGASRDGQFISWDKNVEFNFWRNDLSLLLGLTDMFRRCYRLEIDFDSATENVRLLPRHTKLDLASNASAYKSCIAAGLPYANLYPCWRDGRWIRHPLAAYDFRSMFGRQAKLLSLEGWSFPAPPNPVALLRHRYGSMWAEPGGRYDSDEFRYLIEPFPDNLQCYIHNGNKLIGSRALVECATTLLKDFDRLTVGGPHGSSQIEDALVRIFGDQQIRILNEPVVEISTDFLDGLGCHYCLIQGADVIAGTNLAPELIVADRIIRLQ